MPMATPVSAAVRIWQAPLLGHDRRDGSRHRAWDMIVSLAALALLPLLFGSFTHSDAS